MSGHHDFMQLAIELAERGRGCTSPNPFVGAVLVKDGKVVGKGCTQPCGQDHAEIRALKDAGSAAAGADLYVTLEPCCHYGKTPPCTEAIIRAGIKSVFIGIADPNPKVNGRGIEILRAHGIHTETGWLEEVIRKQLEYYLTFICEHRPFVTLKTAMSLDGRIAGADGKPCQITNEAVRLKVHQLRREHDVLLSGIGTVLSDNPRFNIRLPDAGRQPVRVILDSQLRIPMDCNIVKTASGQTTLIYTVSENKAKAEQLASQDLQIIRMKVKKGHPDVDRVLSDLYQKGYQSIMVEAGTKVNTSFWQAQKVDKLIVFVAPILLGGNQLAWNNLTSDAGFQGRRFQESHWEGLEDNLVFTGYPAYTDPA